MKLTATLPEDRIADGIRYLVIESDEEDTKGFFLFMHRSMDEPCEADLWFASIEEARRQAKYNCRIELGRDTAAWVRVFTNPGGVVRVRWLFPNASRC